jgi:hypothetical protein
LGLKEKHSILAIAYHRETDRGRWRCCAEQRWERSVDVLCDFESLSESLEVFIISYH